jgi:hypothetical protein
MSNAWVKAGSWQAIKWQLRHGNFWTVVDELLHVLDDIR